MCSTCRRPRWMGREPLAQLRHTGEAPRRILESSNCLRMQRRCWESQSLAGVCLVWDMEDIKDTCSCRHNKEGWGKHSPRAQWGGDLVTKDMAEVLNAFLPWLSLAVLAAGPAGPPEAVKVKCYRRGLSTEEFKWGGPDGMRLMVQQGLAEVSAIPCCLWQAVARGTWQWVPHPFPSWGFSERPWMVMVVCFHTKDRSSLLKLK